MTLNEYCTGIADAIRTKEGSTEKIPAPEHKASILAITTQEDLSPELATQDDLIAQIMAALNPEKCKITINANNPYDVDGTAEYAKVYIGSSSYGADYGAEPVEVEVDPEKVELHIYRRVNNVM